MIAEVLRAEIAKLARQTKLSQREIARRLKADRRTVRRIVAQERARPVASRLKPKQKPLKSRRVKPYECPGCGFMVDQKPCIICPAIQWQLDHGCRAYD